MNKLYHLHSQKNNPDLELYFPTNIPPFITGGYVVGCYDRRLPVRWSRAVAPAARGGDGGGGGVDRAECS